MGEMIRIAAVDDHSLFLQGLQRAIGNEPDMTMLAVGSTAEDACRIVAETAPDVLLLDLNIPGGGIEAARAIAKTASPVKIIMVTGYGEDDQVTSALSSGVMGYLLKGAGAAELRDAIRAVHAGRPYVTEELASRLLVQKFGTRMGIQESDVLNSLSDREQQIIRHVTEGLTNKEIAERLDLPVRTVRKRMSAILRKCGARNRLQAVLAFDR
jgi:DNA-binding NarL/FixJ family response regulator